MRVVVAKGWKEEKREERRGEEGRDSERGGAAVSKSRMPNLI